MSNDMWHSVDSISFVGVPDGKGFDFLAFSQNIGLPAASPSTPAAASGQGQEASLC